jgi:hypothetical protein
MFLQKVYRWIELERPNVVDDILLASLAHDLGYPKDFVVFVAFGEHMSNSGIRDWSALSWVNVRTRPHGRTHHQRGRPRPR